MIEEQTQPATEIIIPGSKLLVSVASPVCHMIVCLSTICKCIKCKGYPNTVIGTMCNYCGSPDHCICMTCMLGEENTSTA